MYKRGLTLCSLPNIKTLRLLQIVNNCIPPKNNMTQNIEILSKKDRKYWGGGGGGGGKRKRENVSNQYFLLFPKCF